MPRQERIRHRLCENCGKEVKFTHFQVHVARCERVNKSAVSSSSKASKQAPPEKVSQIVSSESVKEESIPEVIPCYFCGAQQTLAELDTHPSICPQRQTTCNYCQASFPVDLLQEHHRVCSGRMPALSQRRASSRRLSANAFRHFRDPRDVFYEVEQSQDSPPRVQREEFSRRTRNIFLRSSQMVQPDFFGPLGLRIDARMLDFHFISLLRALASHHGQEDSGLSQEAIKQLPTETYGKKEEQEKCSICYCEFEEKEIVKNLPCKHFFHSECIGKWLEINSTCPLCKFNLIKQEEEGPH